MLDMANPRSGGPLEGIRIVDAGMLFAGPLVSTTLGDLGADVIKVEHPKGDEVRNLGRHKDGQGLWWRIVARNKRLVAADVTKPEGAEIVRRLVKTSDVFVENFRPGRVAEWGLDYRTLSALNPGLVMLHISGYGQTGPYSSRAGLGTLAEAFSGYSHTTGEENGPPTLPQFPLADAVAAMTGAYAVLAALVARSRNGGIGDEIDVSLYEPLMSLQGPMVIDFDQVGHVATRRGNMSKWSGPRNTYKTQDGKWLAVAGAANSAALRLFRAMGRTDMAEDPTLSTNKLRVLRMAEIDATIAQWVGERTCADVLKCFSDYDVLGGPVNDVTQILDDLHVQQRGTIVEVPDPVLDKVRVQNVVPRFTNSPGGIRWLGKQTTGADTNELLSAVGYTSDEIRSLEERKVIRTANEIDPALV
jgi:crotonobetainyl-CoA:carnitine CoA-transferase CaiB-like acyl-CoA transferase